MEKFHEVKLPKSSREHINITMSPELLFGLIQQT